VANDYCKVVEKFAVVFAILSFRPFHRQQFNQRLFSPNRYPRPVNPSLLMMMTNYYLMIRAFAKASTNPANFKPVNLIQHWLMMI
jgi:hypothetical protein